MSEADDHKGGHTSTSDDAVKLADQINNEEQNWLEKTNQQTQDIEEEIKRSQPLVGEKEPIETLCNFYNENESFEFFQKAKELGDTYSSFRRIRGDGNCFYRSLLWAQLESIVHDVVERKRFTIICKNWRCRLLKLGFPEFTTCDFCDWFDELLDEINEEKRGHKELFDAVNDDGRSNYYVTFFRLITSGYLRENSVAYEGFIEGGRSMENFCREEIEPMWRDCDHMGIIGLTNAIEVSIRIEYMDRSAAPDGGRHYDFIVNNIPPRLFFLYRPGHYDVLYRR